VVKSKFKECKEGLPNSRTDTVELEDPVQSQLETSTKINVNRCCHHSRHPPEMLSKDIFYCSNNRLDGSFYFNYTNMLN
jgi:hypothetical protein